MGRGGKQLPLFPDHENESQQPLFGNTQRSYVKPNWDSGNWSNGKAGEEGRSTSVEPMLLPGPLFEEQLGKISNSLGSTLEKVSKDVKELLPQINEISQQIVSVSPYQRHKVDFANRIIELWQNHKKTFSIICEGWCENLAQLVSKIGELKKEFKLDINHFDIARLIWNMRKFFQVQWNDNPLPINVIGWVICPAFWCSQEDEGKIVLGGAYQ